MSEITSFDGTTIAFDRTGSGPAIVLHPGVSLPGASFPPVLVDKLVEAGRTVVTIDPRDTGHSSRFDGAEVDLGAIMGGDHSSVPYTLADMARDVLAVLDHVTVESATLAGHSMGGSVIAVAQAMAPERIDGMAFLSCAPGVPTEMPADFLAILLREPPKDRAAAVAWRADLSRWALGQHADESTIVERAEWMVDELGWWGVPITQIAANLVGLGDLEAITPDAAATALIYGDADPIATDQARELSPTLPGASVLELEGYAHWFPEPGPWPMITDAILAVAPTASSG